GALPLFLGGVFLPQSEVAACGGDESASAQSPGHGGCLFHHSGGLCGPHPDGSATLIQRGQGPWDVRNELMRKGDRTTRLFRAGSVVITSWSDTRIAWPRCCLLDTHGGGSGLLVDEELARAIRTESAAAIKHWWGVQGKTVWSWRKALGVEGRAGTEGSQR